MDVYWVGCPIDITSTTRYCVLAGGNIISWKRKKQSVVSWFNAKATYRSMALATCKLVGIKQILQELKFCKVKQMKLSYDNLAALHIVSNPTFHRELNTYRPIIVLLGRNCCLGNIVLNLSTLMTSLQIF